MRYAAPHQPLTRQPTWIPGALGSRACTHIQVQDGPQEAQDGPQEAHLGGSWRASWGPRGGPEGGSEAIRKRTKKP